MKNVFILIVFMLMPLCLLAQKGINKHLKVIAIKKSCNIYLITSVDSQLTDTCYFISINDKMPQSSQLEKIEVDKEYLFELEDMDYIKNHYPSALPNGYKLKIGNELIKREGRDGKTISTTQYRSINTNGLFIVR